jgi:hypothetical protein
VAFIPHGTSRNEFGASQTCQVTRRSPHRLCHAVKSRIRRSSLCEPFGRYCGSSIGSVEWLAVGRLLAETQYKRHMIGLLARTTCLPYITLVNVLRVSANFATVKMASPKQFTVLHIGDDIVYNPDFYETFSSQFSIIQPSLEERQRDNFIAALKERRWGDFHAVFRPFWNSGGEMGKWDQELVPHLPETCRIFTSAGAGYDWADIPTLSKYGECNKAIQDKVHGADSHQESHTATVPAHHLRQLLIWRYGTFYPSSGTLSGALKPPSQVTSSNGSMLTSISKIQPSIQEADLLESLASATLVNALRGKHG